MSSEQLADGVNPLDAELAATWDVLKGYSGRDTDLGIARRFGGAAAAYSLRDIGAMNGRVVKARRSEDDLEEDFSANQVQDGTLEKWVNGELESTLPADVATAAAAYSLRKVKASYGAPTTKLDGSDGFPSNLNDLPLGNYSNAISGSTFTVGHFSTNSGAADSVSLSLGNNSFILRANKATSGTQYGHVIRVQGLSVGKRYTVTGEFKVTKGNGSGTVRMAVDISDATSETDEKSIATTNSTFTPFEVTALFNDSTANVNFIDFTLNDFGGANSGSGPIEGEFRNIKIVESDNRVVRLRRSSDNVEVDVDFDTEGKLSTSSLVGDIAEQGGESGSTTATTLGDFISGTDAFVHTWYDQAGSNDAVQETAGNQPKIAENGALITENNNTAIDFEESSSQFLLISKAFANSSGADVSIFSVSKNVATDGSNAHPIISNRSGSTNGYQFGYDGTDHLEFVHFANTANNAVSTETYETQILGSAIRDNLTFDIFVNSDKRADNTASSYVASTDFTRIGGNENASKFMDGTMQEIVIFESDQSDNRFKIESNINNYYGLYNDANEFSGNPVAAGGASAAITLTNESKTGFTAEISSTSGTKQINFPLLNSLVSGDDYFVSFDYTSTSTSTVGVKPRTAALGSASNDVISATNSGFYGGTGDAAHNGFDVNNTATVLSFQTTAQSFTFTVSNLRVSRIARNGFVETLYDQSGNGDDMTQATAGSQPAIVQNGGQVKLENGKPAFKGDGTDDHLEASYFYSAGEVTAMSTFSVISNRADTVAERVIISAGSGVSTTYPGFNTALDKTTNSNPFEQRVANTSATKETALLNIARDGDILGSTFFTKDGTHLVKATTKDGTTSTSAAITVGAYRGSTLSGKLRIGATRTFALQRFFDYPIAETMVFRADLRDEGIEDEINQFYNIG